MYIFVCIDVHESGNIKCICQNNFCGNIHNPLDFISTSVWYTELPSCNSSPAIAWFQLQLMQVCLVHVLGIWNTRASNGEGLFWGQTGYGRLYQYHKIISSNYTKYMYIYIILYMHIYIYFYLYKYINISIRCWIKCGTSLLYTFPSFIRPPFQDPLLADSAHFSATKTREFTKASQRQTLKQWKTSLKGCHKMHG